jgi:hypothetical protein
MLSNLKLNNDSLLHWCLGPLVGWALFWFVVGIPIHFALGVRSSSIALFLAVQCALQIAVMPWLFAARATASNPHGQTVRRTKVVIGWLALACEAAFLQMSGGDLTHRTAVRFSWAGRSLSARFPLSRFTGFEDTNIETKESDSCWQKDRHHSERSKAHISLLCFMDDSTTTSLDGSPPSSSD